MAARAPGTPLAIVTSAGPAWVERSLVESLGLTLDSVDLVVTARDVVDGKPHPAGFALACERLASTRPGGRGGGLAGRRARRASAPACARCTASRDPRPPVLLAAGAVEVHDDLRPLLALVSRRP